jgi:hypothetical protein
MPRGPKGERRPADEDQHVRRADKHVRKEGYGANGAASNSSTKNDGSGNACAGN